MTAELSCPACGHVLISLRYPLCQGCWWDLPRGTRAALARRDDRAAARMEELRRQLDADTPLHRVHIAA